MKNLKAGTYVFQMEIPVTVLYSKRDDNTVSVDSVSVPTEEELYRMVETHATEIKIGAVVRA